MTTVETRVQNAILTAVKNLVIPRVELAMKSVNTSSGCGVDSVVLDPDRRDFSGNIEGHQMPFSNRLNSHADLNRIHKTCGDITVEEVIRGSTKEIWTGQHTLITRAQLKLLPTL